MSERATAAFALSDKFAVRKNVQKSINYLRTIDPTFLQQRVTSFTRMREGSECQGKENTLPLVFTDAACEGQLGSVSRRFSSFRSASHDESPF